MRRVWFLPVLLGFVLVSALAVVYAKHQNRKLYTQLTGLQKQRDNMNVEWGRLQLELSTWATHGRIEKVARQHLGMRNVDYNQAMIIKP